MKKRLVLPVLLALAAVGLWLGASKSPVWSDNNLGLGQKVAGGWLASLDIAGDKVEVMFNFAADGGLMINSTLREWDSVNGGWLGTRYNTTAHGAWVRTGPGQLQGKGLLFVQDEDGKTVLYETGAFTVALNPAGTTLEGDMEIQLIWADTDPLNPDPDRVLVTLPATLAARRIRP